MKKIHSEFVPRFPVDLHAAVPSLGESSRFVFDFIVEQQVVICLLCLFQQSSDFIARPIKKNKPKKNNYYFMCMYFHECCQKKQAVRMTLRADAAPHSGLVVM